MFLIKLYEICYWKVPSKFKSLLKLIILTKLFEKVQINFIDMRLTLNIISNSTYK